MGFFSDTAAILAIVGRNSEGGDPHSIRFATFGGLIVGFSVFLAFVCTTTFIGFASLLVGTLQQQQVRSFVGGYCRDFCYCWPKYSKGW